MRNTTTTTEPILYVVWHRAGKGSRWRKAGRASSQAEALTMVGGPGDWHIAPLRDERLAGEPVVKSPDVARCE